MLASVDGVEASPGPASASRCARKSRGHRPPGGCPRGCDVDELLVDELAKTQFGQLSPEPGVLDAAERQLCSGPHRLIDEDHAALNPLREPPPAIDVGCEDGDAPSRMGCRWQCGALVPRYPQRRKRQPDRPLAELLSPGDGCRRI